MSVNKGEGLALGKRHSHAEKSADPCEASMECSQIVDLWNVLICCR